MSFFFISGRRGVGFSRLTKFGSHTVYISCIQLKDNTISLHNNILSRLLSIHLMLAKTKNEENQKINKKLRQGVNIRLKRQVRPTIFNVNMFFLQENI